MPHEDIIKLKQQQSVQEEKINAIEKTLETKVDSLVTKLDKLADAIHESTIESAKISIQQTEQLKYNERMNKRMDKLVDDYRALSNEVVENRPIIKIIKGIGAKLLGYTVAIVVSCGGVVAALLTSQAG